MNLRAHQIVKRPIITEESQIQTEKANQYTFRVNPKANKQQIRDAIEEIFPDVQVVKVNTLNVMGKKRRVGMTRRASQRADWKKAIVTLRAGDKIELI